MSDWDYELVEMPIQSWKPRWWQLRLRLSYWRDHRRWKKLPPEAKAAVEKCEADVTRELFFGPSDSYTKGAA